MQLWFLDDFNQNHWPKLLSDFFTNEKDIENLVKNAIELFKKIMIIQ